MCTHKLLFPFNSEIVQQRFNFCTMVAYMDNFTVHNSKRNRRTLLERFIRLEAILLREQLYIIGYYSVV